MDGITLSEYATAKKSTIDDVVCYAKTKGIALRANPDYVISSSELKIIDPIFCFQRRTLRKKVSRISTNKDLIGTIESQHTESSSSEVSEQSTSVTHIGEMDLAQAGKHFGLSWSEISKYLTSINLPIVLHPQTRLTDAQYNALNTHFGEKGWRQKMLLPFDDILCSGEGGNTFIGVVQFYDNHCNYFGYISTNALLNSKKEETSLRFEESDIDYGTLTDDNLVFFKQGGKGKATHICKITSQSVVNWYCALRYIKQYNTIYVSRRSNQGSTISNVLERVVRINSKGLFAAILSILEKLNVTSERQKAFLGEYLSISCIHDVIISEIENYGYTEATKLLIDSILSRAIETENFNLFFQWKDKFPQVVFPPSMSDVMRAEAFARYKDVDLLTGFTNDSTRNELVAQAIKKLPEDEQQEILNYLDDSLRELLLTTYLQDSPIGKRFLKEKWDAIKASLPYVVFDIESDGENISQFCFKQEDNIREYNSEIQLKSLGRALRKQPIIVGHNIRIWDIPILEKKGIITDSFIWDTLEMEILLNPCRYAYSLHTKHNAAADTELTDKLFWNQLFRLAKDEYLRSALREFLPSQIDSIIEDICQPEFAELLVEEAHVEMQFFQEQIVPSISVLSALIALNDIQERSLIIAPKSLWARIAQYVRVAFPRSDDEFSYSVIDKDAVLRSTELGAMKRCVLLRYIQLSKTPVVCNLAQYLRVETISNNLIQISDSILKEYTKKADSNIDCIDIDAFSDPAILDTDYKHIYIVGSELQDRTHKCQLGHTFSFSDLLSLHSKLPFSMASTSYCRVDDSELAKLGLEKPSLTANVWAERDAKGTFCVYHNYEYKLYRNNFLNHYENITPQFIKWGFTKKSATNNILLYTTDKRAVFDSSIFRLSSSTTIRSKYYTYQMAMIRRIHENYTTLPIVYIINNFREYGALSTYARALGFYIPEEGTAFRKLEYIQSHPHGMVIIDKNQFLNGIGDYRTDNALCYVWDNMDVERHQLMWRKLPFENDPVDNDDEKSTTTTDGVTEKQCILAEWPLFEYYYSLIAANSRESKLCIIEPVLEEYSDISDLVECSQEDVILWDDKEIYTTELHKAQEYFVDESFTEVEIKTEEAMAVIRDNFLKQGNDWYRYQREVLPIILQKQSDCIVSIPTGGGKSVLYQGPAIYRAAYSRKLSLVITPLRALMQDQVEDLRLKGFYTNVDFLSGDKTYAEVQQIYRRVASGEIALLYITPERFRVRSFIDILLQRMEMDHGLEYVIYDEAHCISQWGQEFRPDYRNAVRKCVELKSKYPFTMAFFSATITTQVENDIRSQVPDLIRIGQSSEDYNPIRNHIDISFSTCPHEEFSRIGAIVQYIIDNNIDFSVSRMLVFCRTHKQCEEVADALEQIFSSSEDTLLSSCAGHISYFHAGLDIEQRNDVYECFKSDEERQYYILCATKAFGMGMDIPNIHYMVHFTPPSVLEDYLQEVGRAGRDEAKYNSVFPSGEKIPALCLKSTEDFAKLKDLLIKSQITWSDIKDAREKAVEFITHFQSVEQTRSKPIVLPYIFWQKSGYRSIVDDSTSAKLALHWLEYMGYIRQGYICQAYLDITLLKHECPKGTLSKRAAKVFEYILLHVGVLNAPALVSMVDLRNQTHYPIPRIFDAIIECQKYGLFILNDKIQCALHPRRYLETKYMLKENENIYALHILMEGMRNVLSNCKHQEDKILHPDEICDFCEHLLDDVHYKTVSQIKKKRNGEQEETVYMPWYKYLPNPPKGAVTKANTFRKNIITRVGFRVFSVMNFIPGVICKLQKIDKDECHVISVKSGNWYDYIQQLEIDCWNWLKYMQEKETTSDITAFEWASALIELGWDKSHSKGYNYFESILTILRMISYIDYIPTVQTGIEIYTTNTTSAEWDAGESEDSRYHTFRTEFDEEETIKKIRLAAMNVFAEIPHSQQGEYIRKYFLCRSYSDFLDLIGEYALEDSSILSQIKEEALRREEARLDGNAEQLAIYKAEKSENINVLAGPGSGKTHILTLRCAKLIYREAVEPGQILILAYNRAVVAELRTRLDSLFLKLGMSRVSHQLHVYTFHALARKTMGTLLDSHKPEEWESLFREYLTRHHDDFRAIYPNIRFVMVDEFQDITQIRLDSLMEMHKIYPEAKFFTIGDINQSIYGFDRVPRNFQGTASEYAQWLDPRPYYNQLREQISPLEMQMFTNYRSYQDILDAAAVFLPKGGRMPTSSPALMKHEPDKPYVFIADYTQDKSKKWMTDLPDVIQKAKAENATNDPNRKIRNIAIFFRTNSEVYRGFSQIKKNVQIPREDIRIRIQGASCCELWREREVYEIIKYLETNADCIISLRNSDTQNELHTYIQKLHEKYVNWDAELLDITYSIILNYLDSIRSDEDNHTYGEIASYIRDIAGRDDGGQVYKIFEQYESSHLWSDDRLTIVLTTMHKVKGLEFDIVMITPSFADLPIKLKSRYGHFDAASGEILMPNVKLKSPNEADVADIAEEKRLLFVAYTRAKKFLYVYKWKRELAIEGEKLFAMPANEDLRYTEKEAGIDKYFLSYTAQNGKFDKDAYIRENVKKDDAVDIGLSTTNNGNSFSYEIRHKGRTIGQLSSKSNIVKVCKENNISNLKGFFVSDVFIWSYQETIDADMKNGTHFAQLWCDQAKQQGYITIVQIAGFGQK